MYFVDHSKIQYYKFIVRLLRFPLLVPVLVLRFAVVVSSIPLVISVSANISVTVIIVGGSVVSNTSCVDAEGIVTKVGKTENAK